MPDSRANGGATAVTSTPTPAPQATALVVGTTIGGTVNSAGNVILPSGQTTRVTGPLTLAANGQIQLAGTFGSANFPLTFASSGVLGITGQFESTAGTASSSNQSAADVPMRHALLNRTIAERSIATALTGRPSSQTVVTRAAQSTAHVAGTPYNVVSDCGADPTGKVDSTAAIQNCFDEAAAAQGSVLYPTGTYAQSEIVLPSGSGTGTSVDFDDATVNGIYAANAALFNAWGTANASGYFKMYGQATLNCGGMSGCLGLQAFGHNGSQVVIDGAFTLNGWTTWGILVSPGQGNDAPDALNIDGQPITINGGYAGSTNNQCLAVQGGTWNADAYSHLTSVKLQNLVLNKCGNSASLYPGTYIEDASPLDISAALQNGAGLAGSGSFFVQDSSNVTITGLRVENGAADGLDLAGIVNGSVSDSTFSNDVEGIAIQNAGTPAHLNMNGVALTRVSAISNSALGFGFGAVGDNGAVTNLACNACVATNNGGPSEGVYAAGYVIANGSTVISDSQASDTRSGLARTQTYGLTQL